MITLRPYQQAAVDAVFREWETHNSTMIAMSTGLGKTETFLAVLARAAKHTPNFRALVIAHRSELIEQPRERIKRHWLHALPIPGIVMGATNEANREITIATVQTLMPRKRNGSQHATFNRLRDVLQHGPITHIITDECHHAVAPSYLAIFRALQFINPNVKHLGVTATPKRSDESGLKKVYQSVAYRVGIKDAIELHQSLVPPIGFSFTLPVSLANVRVTAGDYSSGDLDKLLSAENVNEIIVEKWLKHGENRPTMAFCAGVQQAQMLAEVFNAAGIPAGFASGNTPKRERRQIIRDFKSGKYKVLCNCALWTEGFDAPIIGCVIMARPTKSDTVYVQAVGRGLRLHPTKADCLIMDFAPMDGRDLVMAGDLLGVPRKQRKAQNQAKDDDIILDVFGLREKPAGIDADPNAVVIQVIDYFRKSPLKWTHDGMIATATVSQSMTIAVIFPQENRIAVADDLKDAGNWLPEYDEHYTTISSYQAIVLSSGKQPVRLGNFDDWGDALKRCEDFAQNHLDKALAKKSQRWRNQAPSDKQKTLATKLGVFQNGMSKGSTAQAITHAFAKRNLLKFRLIKDGE